MRKPGRLNRDDIFWDILTYGVTILLVVGLLVLFGYAVVKG